MGILIRETQRAKEPEPRRSVEGMKGEPMQQGGQGMESTKTMRSGALAPVTVLKPEAASAAGRRRVEALMQSIGAAGACGLAELAHDARNLGTALALYCDLLEEPGVLSPAFRHYAGELRLVATASRRLVERMAALESGGSTAARRPPVSDPASLLRGELSGRARRFEMLPPEPVVNLAQEVLANRNLLGALAGPGIALTVSVEGGARPVRLNGEDLTRILVNLVKNAAEAMPGGGAIRVVLSEPALVGLALSGEAQTGGPARLRLTVEDNGPGIPAAALARIFESGYTTRAAAGGACHRGLGLSITRAIVAQAGGRIYATSAPGAGACIEIELPSNR